MNKPSEAEIVSALAQYTGACIEHSHRPLAENKDVAEANRATLMSMIRALAAPTSSSEPIAWLPSNPSLPFGLDWSHCRTSRTEYFDMPVYASPFVGDVDLREDAERWRFLFAQEREDFRFSVVTGPHFDVFSSKRQLKDAIDQARAHPEPPNG